MSTKFTRNRYRVQPPPKVCKSKKPGLPPEPPPNPNPNLQIACDVNLNGLTLLGQPINITTTITLIYDSGFNDWRAPMPGTWDVNILSMSYNPGGPDVAFNASQVKFTPSFDGWQSQNSGAGIPANPSFDTGPITLLPFAGSVTGTCRAYNI